MSDWNRRSAASGASLPDVDWLSNVIREADGQHKLGAGALAEKIVAAMLAAPSPVKEDVLHEGEPLNWRHVPNGWKLIARDPTQEMMDAFNSGREYLTWGDCFRRLWDAAPSPVKEEEQEDHKSLSQGETK